MGRTIAAGALGGGDDVPKGSSGPRSASSLTAARARSGGSGGGARAGGYLRTPGACGGSQRSGWSGLKGIAAVSLKSSENVGVLAAVQGRAKRTLFAHANEAGATPEFSRGSRAGKYLFALFLADTSCGYRVVADALRIVGGLKQAPERGGRHTAIGRLCGDPPPGKHPRSGLAA